MAKKSKKTEEVIVDAVDIMARIKMNVKSNPSMEYSPCAFGTEFTNWKNYIEKDVETMKKNFMPSIGSLVKDQEGNTYRFEDIRKETAEERVNNEPVSVDVYIFDLMIVQ